MLTLAGLLLFVFAAVLFLAYLYRVVPSKPKRLPLSQGLHSASSLGECRNCAIEEWWKQMRTMALVQGSFWVYRLHHGS
jgi:hypothetical protein